MWNFIPIFFKVLAVPPSASFFKDSIALNEYIEEVYL